MTESSREAPVPMQFAEPYDLTPYPHIWDLPPASVDRRHLFWKYDVLCAGRFQHALEIGCLHGASSTAFIEAINRRSLERATFCDLELRESLRATLHRCQFPERITTCQKSSVELLGEIDDFDFAFIDGDHRMETVQAEVDLVLRRMPVCVMAHDTNAQASGFADCDGPPLIKFRFQTTAPYMCLEDSAVRPGEITQRGMFLATTSREVFEAARTSFEKWCSIGGRTTG